MTDPDRLHDYFRLVLRATSATASPAPAPAPAPAAAASAAGASPARSIDPPPAQRSSGSPVAVRRTRALFVRTKLASDLKPGDVIRLETGQRVTITYVSSGMITGSRFIEWRGPQESCWANVLIDEPVVLG